MLFDESAYLILAQRYKELSAEPSDPSDDGDAPYDLVGYLTEIDTGVIDSNYMNSRFDKYLKLLNQAGASGESIEQAKAELHKSFASLTQEEQKFANIFLHDIERGDASVSHIYTYNGGAICLTKHNAQISSVNIMQSGLLYTRKGR